MLANLKDLLKDAKENNYAIGAFNTPTLQNIRAVIGAAEELNLPVILMHAETHEQVAPLEEIGPIMLDYANKASVPVAVHYDHGGSFDGIMKAIQLGFTSVMYDGSSEPYAENVENTKEIVKYAHSVGVSVEAELGHIFTSTVGGGEGGTPDSIDDYEDLDEIYTDPNMAKKFVEETNVDCLAIAFGTTHGVYLTDPVLDLDRIDLVRVELDVPLVMHGGSGLSEDNYRKAINNGIRKINFYTYMNRAGGDGAKEAIKEDNNLFEDISVQATAGMKKEVKRAMKLFANGKI